MARNIDRLIEFVRREQSLGMSPVLRQVLVNRIDFPPTDAEIQRARDQVMGRTPATV